MALIGYRMGIQGVDGAGKPDGNYLTSSLFTIDEDDLIVAGKWKEHTFEPITLTNGTQYAIVINQLGSNTHLGFRVDSGEGYAPNKMWQSADAGSTWTDAEKTMLFQEMCIPL